MARNCNGTDDKNAENSNEQLSTSPTPLTSTPPTSTASTGAPSTLTAPSTSTAPAAASGQQSSAPGTSSANPLGFAGQSYYYQLPPIIIRGPPTISIGNFPNVTRALVPPSGSVNLQKKTQACARASRSTVASVPARRVKSTRSLGGQPRVQPHNGFSAVHATGGIGSAQPNNVSPSAPAAEGANRVQQNNQSPTTPSVPSPASIPVPVQVNCPTCARPMPNATAAQIHVPASQTLAQAQAMPMMLPYLMYPGAQGYYQIPPMHLPPRRDN